MTDAAPLYLPRKDLPAEDKANVQALESWAVSPKDFLYLKDHETLPTVTHYEEGMIVRVGSQLYQQVAGAWVNYSYPLSVKTGTISTGSIAAQSAVNVGVTVAGVTTADTVVLLSHSGAFSFIFCSEPTITGVDTVNVLVRNYSSGAFDPSDMTGYFLHIQGLNGP